MGRGAPKYQNLVKFASMAVYNTVFRSRWNLASTRWAQVRYFVPYFMSIGVTVRVRCLR